MRKIFFFTILVVIVLVMGSNFMSYEVNAGEYVPYKCVIPYNIKVGDWNTGIHITANYTDSEEFTIYFSGGGHGNYKAVKLYLSEYPGGWTGWIQDLFNLPELEIVKQDDRPIGDSLISPSCITIYSKRSWFTVSQFIINSVSGYGFQTFYAWPSSSTWPY